MRVSDLGTYAVNNLYPTVQGEGIQAGIPMILLRLQGCDVGCPFCDTKETWQVSREFRKDSLLEALGQSQYFTRMTSAEISDYLGILAGSIKWVLITGGEPARYDLNPLIDCLHESAFQVAIETSGTYMLKGKPDWICVSPKVNMPGKRTLVEEVMYRADELKFVIGKKADIEVVHSVLKHYPTKQTVQVCLQPISQSKRATKICLDESMKQGWRLSLQMHRYIGID